MTVSSDRRGAAARSAANRGTNAASASRSAVGSAAARPAGSGSSPPAPKSEESKDAGSVAAARPRATEDAGIRRFAGSPIGDVREEAELASALDGAGQLDLVPAA